MKRICSHCGCFVAALFLVGCGFNKSASFQGYVEGEFVNVATSASGQLEQLQVVRGAQVAAGDPLFVLESGNESAALGEAMSRLFGAEAQLSDLLSGKRSEEIDVLESQLAKARSDASFADSEWKRAETQFASTDISQSELDRARANQAGAQARVQELSHQIAVANLPAREDQIRAQREQVAAAHAAVARAEWQVRQKEVAAPVAGLVFDTLYRPGEWVGAGRPVVRLLPPENVKVRFFVPEERVGALQIGQEVVVLCDGCSEEIAARISYISTEVEYTPPVIYSSETRSKLVFLVEAQPVPDGKPTLHPGQPVRVRSR